MYIIPFVALNFRWLLSIGMKSIESTEVVVVNLFRKFLPNKYINFCMDISINYLSFYFLIKAKPEF